MTLFLTIAALVSTLLSLWSLDLGRRGKRGLAMFGAVCALLVALSMFAALAEVFA